MKKTSRTTTKALLRAISHNTTSDIDLSLKIADYDNQNKGEVVLDCPSEILIKKEITLDNEEIVNLRQYLSKHIGPLSEGKEQYTVIGDEEVKTLEFIDKHKDDLPKIIEILVSSDLEINDLKINIELKQRKESIGEFQYRLENMEDFKEDRGVGNWQKWFTENKWVFGTDFIKILKERDIDTNHQTDYLTGSYDGFVDIIEIKNPVLPFWKFDASHKNYYPSPELSMAITQSLTYIHEMEMEANSDKTLSKLENNKIVKPRCILVYGRSEEWGEDKNKNYRILNASFHNLTILTYDHLLNRAKSLL